MSTFGLFLVFVGILIIATRGPLIVAPEATRNLYMGVMKTDARMRYWGVFAVALGAISVWASTTATGLAASIAFWLGLFIAGAAGIGMLLFAPRLRAIAEGVWTSFTPPILRGLGLLSVGIGAFLVWYGLQF